MIVAEAVQEPVQQEHLELPLGRMAAGFRLPAGARLYVDGRLTGGDAAERTFYTPPLAPRQKYFYDVRAEVTVGGAVVTEEKRVIVEAGAQIVETFPKLIAATEKSGAAVASK